MTAGAVTIGHVNLDHVVLVNRPIEADVTSLVSERLSPAGGRLGGCAANIAVGLADGGIATAVVSRVGSDADGDHVLAQLRDRGVDTAGIESRADRRTGVTWLPSVPGGESYCVYDPGGPPPGELTPAQAACVEQAEWLIAAVGPPGPCAEAIERLRDDARLVWAVKADPESVPPELVRALIARADAIIFNEPERRFVAAAAGGEWESGTRPGALIVETLGVRGARAWRDGESFAVDVPAPVEVSDAVGAGDAFTAGLALGLIEGSDPDAALRRGVAGAAQLLADRTPRAVISQ